MKIFYIDDQRQDLPIVEHALAEIERLAGTKLPCDFIGPAPPGERQLHFDEEARPILTSAADGGVSAALIEAAASITESMFLIDVRFPNDDDYGLQLARHLVDERGIAAERIVLFTMFPEEVHRAEVATTSTAWFTYFHKAKFRLPAPEERLASELVGVIWRLLFPLAVGAVAPSGLVGESPRWRQYLEQVNRAALTDFTVLICGENGTGKELLAKAIHQAGTRSHAPLIPVNCGAIPAATFESEFFGYVKGAFTGATQNKDGLFKAAGEGSIFLDEVSEIPLHLQVTLLRALQEREVRPLGSNAAIKVNCRIIAATNSNLEERVQSGTFREDLYYRLNVIKIDVPPLRERKEDIPALVNHFLAAVKAEPRGALRVSSEALEVMRKYDWPGNVRELENAIARGFAFAIGGLIGVQDLRLPEHSIARPREHRRGSALQDSRPSEGTPPRLERPAPIESTHGQGTRGAPGRARTTWADSYQVLPGLSSSKVSSHRTDRVYFRKVLQAAAMENTDCRSWIYGVLEVLATFGPMLVTSLNDAESRFLGFLIGVIHRYVGGGDAFLRDTCLIPQQAIEACISRAERGDGHGIENAWARLRAARGGCEKLLASLVAEVASKERQ